MSFQRSPPQGLAGCPFANLFPRTSKKPHSRRSGTHSQKKRPQQGRTKQQGPGRAAGPAGAVASLPWPGTCTCRPRLIRASRTAHLRSSQSTSPPRPDSHPPPRTPPPSAIPLIRRSPPTRHLHKTQTSPSTACDSNANKGGRSRGTFPQFTKVRTSTGLNLYRSCIPRTRTTLPWRPFQLQLERKTTAEKQSGF